ncbi:MAG: IclR family transcriptional regulator [Actinomycetota bacterium]
MLSSLANGLRVLEYLIDQGEAGVSETARALKLTVGTTHRLVGTLVEAGFVSQNASNRKYRPTSKMTDLARASRGDIDFIGAAHPFLERLQNTSGETVNLAVLRDNSVVYIDRAVSDQPLSVAVKIGSRVPAYCTSLGRALLAFGPELVRSRYLAHLQQIAAKEVQEAPSKRDLARMLDDARARGFADDDGEFYPDIACYSAPLLGRSGEAEAAISISGPRARMRQRQADLVPLVQVTAKELSDLLQSVGDVHL